MAKHSKLMAEKIIFGLKQESNVQNLQIQIKECDIKLNKYPKGNDHNKNNITPIQKFTKESIKTPQKT
jgi:hypothetical protein